MLMTILFLVAVLLAIPSSGLSIAVFLVLLYMRHRSRSGRFHGSDNAAASAVAAGSQRLPSWVKNQMEIDIFIEATTELLAQEGVPKAFVLALYADKDFRRKMFFFAGEMEANGSTFVEQQVAIIRRIKNAWLDHVRSGNV